MKYAGISLSRLGLLTACVSLAGWSQVSQNDGSQLPGKHVYPTRSYTPATLGAVKDTSISSSSANGITYHGGPIMLGTINVYYIWYGSWSGPTELHAITVLQNLANNIGGSPYFNITTTYSDGNQNVLSNSVHFAGSMFDNYSQGSSIDDTAVSRIVSSAILSGQLPRDTNGVYFVLTSGDVKEITGFCTEYCGWHFNGSMSGLDIKYAFVGDPTACLPACTYQINSPNNDAGVDGMASVISHELEEAATDPDLNAWYDLTGNECADKCAWTFGTTYAAGNGSRANMKLGGIDYLIQRDWVNASGGYCALSYAPPGPTLTTISPAGGVPGTTVPVTLTGTGFAVTSTINVSGSGIVVANPVVVSATEITANFIINSGTAGGGYSVSVMAPSGTTLPRTFTVTSTAPTLTSVNPSSGLTGTNVPVTLTGTNFVSPVTVNISGSGVTPAGVTVLSSTQITATFDITSGADLGGHSVSVTTGNGTSGTVTFTVAQATPTLTSVSPSSGFLGASVPVKLTGTNFISPVTLNISGSGVTATGVSVVSSTQINATFNILSGAATGGRNVSVTTANGSSGSATFTVMQPAPTLTSISPSSASLISSTPVTLTGTNFVAPATLNIGPSGVSATAVTVVSSTQITANFSVASNATPGAHNVSVSTSGGTSGAVAFTVNGSSGGGGGSGPPSLFSITPSAGSAGTTVKVNLSGTNLASNPVVQVTGNGVTVTSVGSSGTTLNATFVIDASAKKSTRFVSVKNSFGVSNTVDFTVQ